MNASSIFTRSRMGLDSRVWLTMIVTILLSFIVLGLKLAIMGSGSGTNPGITVTGDHGKDPNAFLVNRPVTFKLASAEGKAIKWDFGDGTIQLPGSSGSEIAHIYAEAGTYNVIAWVADKKIDSVSVTIVSANEVISVPSASAEVSGITGPDAPHAGESVNYATDLVGQSYEWSVLNDPNFAVQTTPVASYSFTTPGSQTIELKLDHDDSKVYRKTIQILPAEKTETSTSSYTPPPVIAPAPTPVEKKTEAKPEAPKATVIADEEFKNLFDAVVEGKKDAPDFNQFLCNGGETNVLLNGDTWETVASFCAKIHDKKKFVIKTVKVIRGDNNCVSVFKIEYKKKLIAF